MLTPSHEIGMPDSAINAMDSLHDIAGKLRGEHVRDIAPPKYWSVISINDQPPPMKPLLRFIVWMSAVEGFVMENYRRIICPRRTPRLLAGEKAGGVVFGSPTWLRKVYLN